MHPFQLKYHQTQGTHCWFCERQFGIDKQVYVRCGSPLIRTREHIIPKSKIIYSHPRNYIASCADCNSMKGNKNAKQFAMHIEWLMCNYSLGEHNMFNLFPMIRKRAWKLYNKTSNFHRNYKKLRA